jgi:hypothetical protein
MTILNTLTIKNSLYQSKATPIFIPIHKDWLLRMTLIGNNYKANGELIFLLKANKKEENWELSQWW